MKAPKKVVTVDEAKVVSIKPSKLDVRPKNMGSFKEITIEAKYHGFTPEKIVVLSSTCTSLPILAP